VVTSAGKVTIGTSQRSSVDSQIAWVAQWVANVGRLAGAEIHQNDGYPGWKPDLDSKILKAAQKTYKRLFKEEPVPKAIHAGLECGIIGAKFPGMDMVSLGPEILNAHSPDEEVNIKSVQKTYKYLLELLKDIA
jgi:dipeptidase D